MVGSGSFYFPRNEKPMRKITVTLSSYKNILGSPGKKIVGEWGLRYSVPPPHKVSIYKEYHSVCPLVGILSQPLSSQRVCPSPQNGGEGGGRTLAFG